MKSSIKKIKIKNIVDSLEIENIVQVEIIAYECSEYKRKKMKEKQ